MNDKPRLWEQGKSSVSVEAAHAKQVFVAGSFNGWNATSHPLKRIPDGDWVLTLDLPPGEYEYKFVIDGRWICHPGCDGACKGCEGCVPNAFGTMNRILKVADHQGGTGHLSASRPDCASGFALESGAHDISEGSKAALRGVARLS